MAHARWLRHHHVAWGWRGLTVLGVSNLWAAGGCGDSGCPAGYEKFEDVCRSSEPKPARAGAAAGLGGEAVPLAGPVAEQSGAGGEPSAGASAEAADGGVGECKQGNTRSCTAEGVGECSAGAQTCSAGAWGECVSMGARDEVCNGRDDDCDGNIDEALEMTCGSSSTAPCRLGKRTCVSGRWSECTGAVEPQPEVCDAEMHDENCDGQLNEGCECTLGATRTCAAKPGICKPGTQSCVEGRWSSTCDGEEPGPSEKCDGMDNDCDGKVDNGTLCEPDYVCRGESGCVRAEPSGIVRAAIETANGYYVSFVNGGGVRDPMGTLAISTAATTAGANETFYVEWQDATYDHFALRTSSGRYLSAASGGGLALPYDATSAVRTDARTIGAQESLTLDFDPKADTVTIRSLWNYYLSAQSGDGVRTVDSMPLRSDAASVGPWETFSWVKY